MVSCKRHMKVGDLCSCFSALCGFRDWLLWNREFTTWGAFNTCLSPPPPPLWFHSLSGTKNFVCMSIVPILVTTLRSQFTVYLGEIYCKSIAKNYGRLWGNLIKLDTEAVLGERASAVIKSILVGKMMKYFCQTDIFLKQIRLGTKDWFNPLTTKIL